MNAKCWWWLIPPGGVEVRRLVAWLTLAAGLPRLPLLADLFAFAPLRYFQPSVYGVLLTALGVALVITSYRGRLAWYGRLTAAVGVAAWAMLAAATLSVTSLLMNVAVAIVLLREVWTVRHDV